MSCPPLLDAAPPTEVEYIFYPSPFDEYRFTWPGPDPLSADTCAEDMFIYTSAILKVAAVDWIDFRLCEINRDTQELVSQYWFLLPRTESLIGNLCRVRGQMLGIVSRRSHAGSAHRAYFRLFLCPWQEMDPVFPGSAGLPAPRALDPKLFVWNISGNFS